MILLDKLERYARYRVQAEEPLSASELAGRCGLSLVTARRYLEHLAVEGVVTLSMRYGGTGRPEHLYARPS